MSNVKIFTWVPHIKRTELNPAPYSSRAFFPASITTGWDWKLSTHKIFKCRKCTYGHNKEVLKKLWKENWHNETKIFLPTALNNYLHKS